ncbi:hypothetical protein K438DRAFT_1983347 [Mycena galopus ATCC 62051]|nr:hypothetical protein K438DRAFT_1983347 [Mycena galopus ATCC 62051]
MQSTTSSSAATESAGTTYLGSPLPVLPSFTTVSVASISLSLSSSAAATSTSPVVSAPPSVCASRTIAAQLPALRTELQKLVLIPSCNTENEVELGGRLRVRSGKNSIGSEGYSVLLRSPAPVLPAGVRTAELGGPMDNTSALHQQGSISDEELRTVHKPVDCAASSSLAPSAPSPT